MISRVLGSIARVNHAHAFGCGQPAGPAKRLAISCFPKWRRKVLRLGTSSSVASRGTRPQSSSPRRPIGVYHAASPSPHRLLLCR